MRSLNTDVYFEAETEYVAELIGATWSPIDDLRAILAALRDAARHAARGWVNEHALRERARSLYRGRELLLVGALGLPPNPDVLHFDATLSLLDYIIRTADMLATTGRKLDGPLHFNPRPGNVLRVISYRHPQLIDARPLGWDVLAGNWRLLLDMDPFSPRAHLHDGPLETRISLRHVLLNEELRRHSPPSQLIKAVYAHFTELTKQLNTERLTRDLQRALPGLHRPALQFDRTDVRTDNPFLKVALTLAPAAHSEEDYAQSCALQRELNALSDVERAKKQEQLDAEFLTAYMTSGSGIAEKRGAAQWLALLQSELPAAQPDSSSS